MPHKFGEEQALDGFSVGHRVALVTAHSASRYGDAATKTLMRGQTVFSTGLFILEPTQITQSDFAFPMRNGFNSSGFDLSALGSTAAQHVYGFQTGQLSYPRDTAPNLAIQHVDMVSPLPVSNYTAKLQGFSTDVDCEILQFKNATQTFLPWFSIQAPYFVVNITTDSCRINNAIVGQGADHGYYLNDTALENYQGRFQNFTCNTGGDNSAQYPPNGNHSMDHRFLLSMAHLEWAPHRHVDESPATWIKQLTAVLCKPRYSIDDYSVSYSYPRDTPRMQAAKIPGTNSTLTGFDDATLLQAVRASFRNTTFGQGGADYIVVPVPSYFQVMKAMHNISTLAPFMDPALLRDSGSSIYQDASAQIAYEQLLLPQESSVAGSLTYVEDRLQVQRVTVGLITTCLGLLICISALQAFIRPWNTVSCEPQSIGALSTILAASQSFRQRLVNTGSVTFDALSDRLSQDKYQTIVLHQGNPAFVLEPLSAFDQPSGSSPSNATSNQWWRPVAVQVWFITLIIALPFCFIVILEILQHVSDSRDGIVDVSNSKVDAPIASTYLPSLFAVILGLLYASLEFASSVFAPLAALRRGNAPAKRSLMMDPLSHLPPLALFNSLRSRYFAQSLAIAAAFVASLLAIVVSALYSVESVTKHPTISLDRADFFELSHVDLSQDDGFAGAVTNLIVYEDTPYPQWTYDNLVLPSVAESAATRPAALANGESIAVTVPALRGSLTNCSALPARSINVEAVGAPPSCSNCNDVVQLTYLMSLPYSLCGSIAKKGTNASWSQNYLAPNDSSVVYAGIGTALQWLSPSADGGGIRGDGGTILNDPRDTISYDGPLDNDFPSCPSVSYSLGLINAGKKTGKPKYGDGAPWTSKQNVTIVYCYQQLEQVMANVTFSYPDFTVNKTTPPVPLEETATVIVRNNTRHWFDISINTLVNSLQKLPVGVTGRNSVNGFIQALSWAHDGIPLDQLYDNGNISTLNAAANRLYGRYAAQAISANMRTRSLPSSDLLNSATSNIGQQPANYAAILTQRSKRLRQNRGPKIALQSMLAFLVVCTLGTYFVMDTRRVVPHNPCSIAGMMSLLADSEICGGDGGGVGARGMIPEGSEWKSGRELRKAGVFDGGGLLLRMGWQQGETGEEIITGDDDDETRRKNKGERFGIWIEDRNGENGIEMRRL